MIKIVECQGFYQFDTNSLILGIELHFLLYLGKKHTQYEKNLHFINSSETVQINSAESTFMREDINLALSHTEEMYRVPFLMYFEGFKYHEIAEELEHIRSEKLVNKLDEFLGYPTLDPHGDPIPNANGEIKNIDKLLLSELNPILFNTSIKFMKELSINSSSL